MIVGKKDKDRISKLQACYFDLCKAIEVTAIEGIKKLEEDGKSQKRKIDFMKCYLIEFKGLANQARKEIENETFTF